METPTPVTIVETVVTTIESEPLELEVPYLEACAPCHGQQGLLTLIGADDL